MNPQVRKKLLKLIPQYNKHKQCRSDITKQIDSFDEQTTSLKEFLLDEFFKKRQWHRKKLMTKFISSDIKTKEILSAICKLDPKVGLPLSRGEVIKLEEDPVESPPQQAELPI